MALKTNIVVALLIGCTGNDPKLERMGSPPRQVPVMHEINKQDEAELDAMIAEVLKKCGAKNHSISDGSRACE